MPGAEPTSKSTPRSPVEWLKMVEGLNRSRGRGYGPTLVVSERPVTRLYVGE
jgi:hypothetical protein